MNLIVAKKLFSTLLLIFMPLFILSCTSDAYDSRGDETGSRTVIGYVDAEPFYLISIKDSVKSSVSYLRGQRTIYYQPSPTFLLRLEYLALRAVIRNLGLKQPAYFIDQHEMLELARERSVQKGHAIVNAVRKGMSMEQAAEQFDVRLSREPIRTFKGRNPGYDDAIWAADIGEISGPVVHHDRVLVFRVEDRGTNDAGEEWADVYLMEFIFDREGARKILLDRLMSKWDIRITDNFYAALDHYFNDNFIEAESNLSTLIESGDSRNGLAYYLLALTLRSRTDDLDDPDVQRQIIDSLEKAVANCADNELRPHFRYELANYYLQTENVVQGVQSLRAAFDELRDDVHLAEKLVDVFEQIEDTEYIPLAQNKLTELQELVQLERAKRPPVTDEQPDIVEDIELNEVEDDELDSITSD